MSDDRAKLKDLMDEILTHPIALAFNLQMSESPYVSSDYSREIRSPMHLGLIERQISNGPYTACQFRDDIQLIYQNAVDYFGEDSAMTSAAEGLADMFEKVCHKHIVRDSQNWGERIVDLRTKMATLFFYRPVIGQTIDLNLDFGKKDLCSQIPSESDARLFIRAAQKLANAGHADELIRIVEEREPGMVSESQHLTIDLARLKISTLQALIKFAKAWFKKKKMKYPKQ
jgi:hypothetical protein